MGREQTPKSLIVDDEREQSDEERQGDQRPEPFDASRRGIVERQSPGFSPFFALHVTRHQSGHQRCRSSDGRFDES